VSTLRQLTSSKLRSGYQADQHGAEQGQVPQGARLSVKRTQTDRARHVREPRAADGKADTLIAGRGSGQAPWRASAIEARLRALTKFKTEEVAHTLFSQVLIYLCNN